MTGNTDGGPAFPYSVHMEGFDRMIASGMSLRQWFAGQALSGLIVGCAGILGREKDGSPHFSAYAKGPCNSVLANRAYAVADDMLRETAIDHTEQVGAADEQCDASIEKEVHSRVEHWRSSVERLQEDCDHLRTVIAEAAEVIAPFAKSARSFPASIYGTDRVHMRADLAPRLVDLRRAQEWFDKHGGSNG